MKQSAMKLTNYYTYPLLAEIKALHAKKLGLSGGQISRQIELEYFSKFPEYNEQVEEIRKQMIE
jgi:hypothetical protein